MTTATKTPRRRKAKELRRSHNYLLQLTEHERDALDSQADHFGMEISTYLRTLIIAAYDGQLSVSQLFSK